MIKSDTYSSQTIIHTLSQKKKKTVIHTLRVGNTCSKGV